MTSSQIRAFYFLANLAPLACEPSRDQPDPPADADDDPDDDPDDGPDDGRDDDPDDDPDDDQARPFFLPTDVPTNTAAPAVAVDAQGGVHAVYPAYAGGDAFYAYCGPNCGNSADVDVVRLPTEGTVAHAMLALDDGGRPHVLLSAYAHVYYATCSGDCRLPEAWSTSVVVSHDNDRQVTGDAFALDPAGHPRFVMHTTVLPLGIGQGAPMTEYVHCDGECQDAASWSTDAVADQIWRSSSLHVDAQGRLRLATAAIVPGAGVTPDQNVAAYVECDHDCHEGDAWIGASLEVAFTSVTDAVAIEPAVSLAMTRTGAPRLAVLAQSPSGTRNVTYLACDSDCTGDGWSGVVLVEDDRIGAGVDLALDDHDRPRLAHTFDESIGIATCAEDHCETRDAPWLLGPVERASSIAPDDIFLWPNCKVGAWFLHSPSIAIAPDGRARIGYQARDVSGGWNNPDPDRTPDCVAGTDLTWTRLATAAAPE